LAADPAPPLELPEAKDQINLIEEDSRIMPVVGGGFEQCYNAQAQDASYMSGGAAPTGSHGWR
jgi:hypothetical protein